MLVLAEVDGGGIVMTFLCCIQDRKTGEIFAWDLVDAKDKDKGIAGTAGADGAGGCGRGVGLQIFSDSSVFGIFFCNMWV